MTEIYFDEPFLTLRWDADTNIICADWKDAVEGEPMRRGLEAGLKLILEKRSRKWLVNSRHLGSIQPADVKWVNDHWMPRAADIGIEWMAFVMAKKVVMQLTMKSFITRINDREINTAYFDDYDSAFRWLRDQP